MIICLINAVRDADDTGPDNCVDEVERGARYGALPAALILACGISSRGTVR